MNAALTAANVALLVVLIVFIIRAAQIHRQARRLRYAALTAQMRVAWCHNLMLRGWHPWAEFPPPAGSLVDCLHHGDTVPRILRVPEDRVPALEVTWWRPYEARQAISHIGGIG